MDSAAFSGVKHQADTEIARVSEEADGIGVLMILGTVANMTREEEGSQHGLGLPCAGDKHHIQEQKNSN